MDPLGSGGLKSLFNGLAARAVGTGASADMGVSKIKGPHTYLHIYTYIYIYGYVFTYIYIYICIYTCTCMRMYIHVYIYIHIFTFMYIYLCVCLSIWLSLYLSVYLLNSIAFIMRTMKGTPIYTNCGIGTGGALCRDPGIAAAGNLTLGSSFRNLWSSTSGQRTQYGYEVF